VTVPDICELARSLPRSDRAVVRSRPKYRVVQVVHLSFFEDGSTLGCGFPKHLRPW
jgi:hypothetical protein